MAANRFQFTKRFVQEQCDFCGLCFHQCPVLELPLDVAQAEIRSLVKGGKSEVLERCTGCMACNTICPTDANPHTLVMSRWNERNQEQGIPVRAGLVLPYQESNLFAVNIGLLPKDERALVEQWERNWKAPPAHDTMLYAGCNMLLQPFLLDSALYKDIPVFGSTEICCGEPLYRIGCWDSAQPVAKRLREEFERIGFKKLVVPCLACFHMFKHVYRDVFNVEFDFEVISIVDWIHQRIRSGEIRIAPLNKTAVIHDSCWPKASGDHDFDAVRKLLELFGVEVLEPRHAREEALCCGMCAGAARFSLLDIAKAARKRQKELDSVEADMAINYCGGCNWLLSLVNKLSFAREAKPMYHILELVQMAIGETPKHRTGQRAQRIISSMAGRTLASYLTRKRLLIE